MFIAVLHFILFYFCIKCFAFVIYSINWITDMVSQCSSYFRTAAFLYKQSLFTEYCSKLPRYYTQASMCLFTALYIYNSREDDWG